jgi:hypothetical protein
MRWRRALLLLCSGVALLLFGYFAVMLESGWVVSLIGKLGIAAGFGLAMTYRAMGVSREMWEARKSFDAAALKRLEGMKRTGWLLTAVLMVAIAVPLGLKLARLANASLPYGTLILASATATAITLPLGLRLRFSELRLYSESQA